jgi:hypothetical protein
MRISIKSVDEVNLLISTSILIFILITRKNGGIWLEAFLKSAWLSRQI